jgi:hypothetical protein
MSESILKIFEKLNCQDSVNAYTGGVEEGIKLMISHKLRHLAVNTS